MRHYSFLLFFCLNFLIFNDLHAQLKVSDDNHLYTISSNLGIGTMNPTEKLEVQGNSLITGRLQVGGLLFGGNFPDLSTDFPKTTISVADTSSNLHLHTFKNIILNSETGRIQTSSFVLEHQGADFILGTNDTRNIGEKPGQRALVHWNKDGFNNADDVLAINYNGDFEGGTRIMGKGLIVDNKIGIGTSNPNSSLHIVKEGADVSLNTDGELTLGRLDNLNLAMDNNEIQARRNGVAGGLVLNAEGGRVYVGRNDLELSSFQVNGADMILKKNKTGIHLRADGSDSYITNRNYFVGNGIENNGNFYMSSESDIIFQTGNSSPSNSPNINHGFDRMIINANGNIGIGIDDAKQKLSVGGDINFNNHALIANYANNSDSNIDHIWHNDSDNSWHFVSDDPYKAEGNAQLKAGSIHLNADTDVSLSGDGQIVLGSITTSNMTIDANEIQARNNGRVSTLFLNREQTNNLGGKVEIGNRGDGFRWGKLYVHGLSDIGDKANVQYNISTGEIGFDQPNFRSDSKTVKRNIKSFKIDYNKILKATPKTYQALDSDYQEIGYVVEDFEELGLTNLIEYDKEGNPKHIKYDRIPLFITPILKQQKDQLEQKDQEIKKLENRLNKLEKLYTELAEKLDNSPNVETIKLSDVKLEQNQPNPFTANTQIKFFLPDHIQTATLLITDANGRLVQERPIQNRGNTSVNVEANTLSKGTYFYSLKVDGELFETKKMILLDKF